MLLVPNHVEMVQLALAVESVSSESLRQVRTGKMLLGWLLGSK